MVMSSDPGERFHLTMEQSAKIIAEFADHEPVAGSRIR
jgi:hypothetical protein